MSTATAVKIATGEARDWRRTRGAGQRAWRGLLRAHACLAKRLDAELEQAHGLPMSSYEVLHHLEDASGGRMRMCDLAEQAQLSRSGLTRLVDRLERERPARALLLRTRRARLLRVPHGRRARAAAGSARDASRRRARAVLLAFLRGRAELLADMCERIAPCSGETTSLGCWSGWRRSSSLTPSDAGERASLAAPSSPSVVSHSGVSAAAVDSRRARRCRTKELTSASDGRDQPVDAERFDHVAGRVAEEVGEQADRGRPGDPAERVPQDERAPVHARRAGQPRGPDAQPEDEAAEEDGLRAVAFEERLAAAPAPRRRWRWNRPGRSSSQRPPLRPIR